MSSDPEEGVVQPKIKVGDFVVLRDGSSKSPMLVIGLEDYGNRVVCQAIQIHSVSDVSAIEYAWPK